MMQVRALAGDHNRQEFDCGRLELNGWLQQVARKHQDKGVSRTFVAVRGEAPTRFCCSCRQKLQSKCAAGLGSDCSHGSWICHQSAQGI